MSKFPVDMQISFDFVDDISLGKTDLLKSRTYQTRDYKPRRVNRLLSRYQDCILLINQMNMLPHLSEELQHDYLLYRVQPLRRRTAKQKPMEETHVDVIMRYFSYSEIKAREALRVLSKKQIDLMVKRERRIADAL